MNRRWWAAGSAVAAFAFAGLLVACSSGPQPTAHPQVPAFTTRPTTSAAPVAPPKSCATVAGAVDVDQIVGHQLAGSANQVVGIPQANIKRTGRLDCYYGIPAGQAVTTAVLSIGISSYTDAPTAQHRVTLTVDSARNAGATTSDVRVGTEHAVVLAGAQTQQLVLSHGNLTVVVTANNGVLTQATIGPQLVALAQRALAAHPAKG
ncbi:MAG TPA: hypothetical protein VEO01_14140 [Pseudonocardiaceae bacterium]|nr:hypothetical protein [Pseudonocardiaceae bacterium]